MRYENILALRYSTSESYEYKEHALKLTNSLVNVRDIVNHFPPKIAAWLAKESLSTPTEQQILAIIIQNYDSLALKLQDNLDQYERYSEKPNHTAFFEEMVNNINNMYKNITCIKYSLCVFHVTYMNLILSLILLIKVYIAPAYPSSLPHTVYSINIIVSKN